MINLHGHGLQKKEKHTFLKLRLASRVMVVLCEVEVTRSSLPELAEAEGDVAAGVTVDWV